MNAIEIGSDYQVQDGDTISEIAYRAYGDARRYVAIIDGNAGLEGFNPVKLRPGLVITIPQPDYLPSPQTLGYRESVGRSPAQTRKEP